MEAEGIAALSPRESNVLSLYAGGLTDKECAAALQVSIHSVRTYWKRIKEKSGKATRAEIIAEFALANTSPPESEVRLPSQAERAAMRSEAEVILGKVPVMAWADDVNGHYYYFNDRFLNYTGLTLDEAPPYPWEKLIPAELFRAVQRTASEARKRDEIFEYQFPIRRHDGKYRWHLVRDIPVYNEAGEVVCRVGTATDIEDLHYRESLTRDERDRLQMIADLSDMGIAYSSPLFGCAYTNAAYRRMTGSPPNPTNWFDAVHPADREHVREKWHKALEFGDSMRSRHRYLREDGSTAWVEARVLRLEEGGWLVLTHEANPEPDSHRNQLAVLARLLEDLLERETIESNAPQGGT
jgi:PAS domain S-box-containing protein